jgi:hypothetical protein
LVGRFPGAGAGAAAGDAGWPHFRGAEAAPCPQAAHGGENSLTACARRSYDSPHNLDGGMPRASTGLVLHTILPLLLLSWHVALIG